jgi:heme/copper-type cytochrome/quinol oxidase subunit 3
MSARPILDVSGVPKEGYDHHGALWWAALIMELIETTMFALLVASYFYVYLYINVWPPPRTEPPSMLDTAPDLVPGTVLVVLLLASCVPMLLADRAARRLDPRSTAMWLLLALAIGVALVGVRCVEFPAIHFRWDSNAYASCLWFLLGFHLMHLAASVVEVALIVLWIWVYGLDEHHAVDATIIAFYWYWMALVWVPIYLIIYFAPRVL